MYKYNVDIRLSVSSLRHFTFGVIPCFAFGVLIPFPLISISFENEGQVLFVDCHISGGQCTWKDSEVLVGRYNPNDLTNSDNIVIWQVK